MFLSIVSLPVILSWACFSFMEGWSSQDSSCDSMSLVLLQEPPKPGTEFTQAGKGLQDKDSSLAHFPLAPIHLPACSSSLHLCPLKTCYLLDDLERFLIYIFLIFSAGIDSNTEDTASLQIHI